MMRRAAALLLALVLLFGLCACGASNSNIADDNVIDNGVEPVPEPVPEPEPPKPVNPLTGEETEEDLGDLRPIGIMINNISYAMPAHGVSDADILIEMNVEGNITRFLALYQQITSGTAKIGSIRSARVYYLNWVEGFDAVYVSASGSKTTRNKIEEKNITYLNVNGSLAGISYRDADRKAAGYAYEHTLFSTGQRFEDGLKTLDIRKTHEDGFDCGLRFTDTAQTASGSPADKVTVKMNSSKRTYFDYDAASGKYLISEHGDKYIDGNTKEQVAVKNVLVLYTKYWQTKAGSSNLSADMSGGKGVYICEGKMIDISWALSADEGIKLTKADGSVLELMPGHSIICCADSYSGGTVGE